jgi:chromosome partitioning protein
MSIHPTPADLELLRNDRVFRHVGQCETCQDQLGALADLSIGLDDTIDSFAQASAYAHLKHATLRRLYGGELPEDLAADSEIHLRRCASCRQLAAEALVESSHSFTQPVSPIGRSVTVNTVWRSDFDDARAGRSDADVVDRVAPRAVKRRRTSGATRFAIVGDVSGAGKTTTAIMLASRLASDRKARVLCIDLDPAGELTQFLMGTRNSLGGGVSRLLEDPTADVAALIAKPKRMRGVSLVPSDRHMRGVEARIAVGVGGTGWETLLRDRIATVLRSFKYVVIDCPSSRGVLTINALAAAEVALIAEMGLDREETRADELGVNSMLKFVSRIRERHNAELRVRVMSTQFDPDDRASWPGRGLTPKAALRFAIARGAKPEQFQFAIYDALSGTPGSPEQLVKELMKTGN